MAYEVFPAAVKHNKKENSKLKYHGTFCGPDVLKLQKTVETAGFDNSGSLPESRIKEFENSKMKAIYPSKKPTEKTDKPFFKFGQ